MTEGVAEATHSKEIADVPRLVGDGEALPAVEVPRPDRPEEVQVSLRLLSGGLLGDVQLQTEGNLLPVRRFLEQLYGPGKSFGLVLGANKLDWFTSPRAAGIADNDVISVVVGSAPRRTATGSLDGTVRFWDTERVETLREYASHDACAVALVEDRLVMSSAGKQPAQVHDLETNQLVASFGTAANTMTGFRHSRSSKIAVVAYKDCLLELRSTTDWSLINTLVPGRGPNFGWFMGIVAIAEDGSVVAATVPGKAVQVWDAKTGELLCRMEGCLATALDFSADGATLAVALRDGSISLRESRSGAELLRVSAHKGQAFGVAFAPGGRHFVSVGEGGPEDSFIKVWDVEGNHICDLSGHTRAVEDVTFSSDGALLATASGDGTARLWKPLSATFEAWECVKELRGHRSGVCLVALP